jgi:hypothetical protein
VGNGCSWADKSPSSKGHKFILAATGYFSKWAEAVALKEVKAENVENFIRSNLIYRFGVPARMISDNGPWKYGLAIPVSFILSHVNLNLSLLTRRRAIPARFYAIRFWHA